jgi:hypothetical protein
MPAIDFPPPRHRVGLSQLVLITLRPGAQLFRVYDPCSRHRPGPRTFRSNGPRMRFDHHRGMREHGMVVPADDAERAVYYCGLTLSGALVEVFGDARMIERGTFRMVRSTLRTSAVVLDLRGDGAMRAGTIAAVGSIERRDVTQAWARWFYETYPRVEGLLYANAHNGEDAVALFERGRRAIEAASQRVVRLARPDMEEPLLRIAARTGMIVV